MEFVGAGKKKTGVRQERKQRLEQKDESRLDMKRKRPKCSLYLCLFCARFPNLLFLFGIMEVISE